MSPTQDLAAIVSAFLAWGARALRPATVNAYRHQLAGLVQELGGVPIRKLRGAHLTAWAKTWHQAQAAIRLFNWAVHEAGLLKKNPFARCRKPRRIGRRRILSPVELVQLLRAAQGAGRDVLLGIRETFARPQEIRQVRWCDLLSEDLRTPLEDALIQGKAVIVLHDWKDADRRIDSSRPRVLLVTKRLGRLLARLRKKAVSDKDVIFKNTRGDAWTKNALRILMRRLRKKLGWIADERGENICAYTLRHSGATQLAAAGVLDRTLADILGHVETRTTQRYQHLQTGHLRDALERAKRKRRPDSGLA